jgi:hypothetical protein
MLHQLAVHSATVEQADVGSGVVLGLLIAALVALLIVRYAKLVFYLLAWLLVAIVVAGIIEIAPVISGVLEHFQHGAPG